MLNIPEYKEYGGETKIALMDNSSLAFMHELSQRSYPSDGILSVYDLILIPKWVMEEIEDSTYRSTYVEQLQAKGYPIRWIDETKYGTFVNFEDVNLYYIVEAAVSRVSELMRFLRRKVKTEDLIDLPSAEEWMNRLYDEWPIHGRTLSTGRTLKKNAGEISLTILAEIFAWYHDGVDSLTIYTQDTDAHEFQTNAERILIGNSEFTPALDQENSGCGRIRLDQSSQYARSNHSAKAVRYGAGSFEAGHLRIERPADCKSIFGHRSLRLLWTEHGAAYRIKKRKEIYLSALRHKPQRSGLFLASYQRK